MTKRITIIAEAGVNYNGDITIAKEMVKAAAASGADYVKFQTGVPKFDVSVFAEKAEYQKLKQDAEQRGERLDNNALARIARQACENVAAYRLIKD